jgi:2-polyprenyl-3-methyl-5-hydroxy-6-metoxy-1,4-benzoquinol methylase
MESYFAVNQDLWNLRTPYHVASEFYNVAEFKAGRDSIDPITLAALGDLSGKSLLHLQCHFGLDTLSWSRRGATVTGADFSEEAIKTARDLAKELNLSATFIQANLYDLPQHLSEEFDVIFTSHGVLCWLPDLQKWADVISYFLKPKGIFYIIEIHPFALLFDKESKNKELRLRERYFRGDAPLCRKEQGSYALRSAPIAGVSYQWFHRLEHIIGALLKAGLNIISYEEYPFMTWEFFPSMEQRPEGLWQLSSNSAYIPLMFSLQATKS